MKYWKAVIFLLGLAVGILVTCNVIDHLLEDVCPHCVFSEVEVVDSFGTKPLKFRCSDCGAEWLARGVQRAIPKGE